MRVTAILIFLGLFTSACFELSSLGARCDELDECDEGQSCVDERCVLEVTSCDCEEDEVCIDGVCQACTPDLCNECFDDGDCAPEESCIEGNCLQIFECNFDQDCDFETEQCIDNICVDPSDCEQDIDCGPLAICDSGTCISTDCRVAQECEANFYCDDGQSVIVIAPREQDYVLGTGDAGNPQSEALCPEGQIVHSASGSYAFMQGSIAEVRLGCAQVESEGQNYDLSASNTAITLTSSRATEAVPFEQGEIECGDREFIIGFRASFSSFQVPEVPVLALRF